MTETVDLLSIGSFSSLTRLSVRMLRYYHEHEVLVPAHIDESGYRWYARDQVADALLVRDLRDVGFGVSALAPLLAARSTPNFERALATQRDVLVQESRAATQRLHHLDRMLHHVRGHTMSNITIDRTTVPAMTVVALRGTVPTYSDEGRLWGQMMPELGRQGVTPIGPGGVFEHDGEYVDENPDLSIFLPVAPGTTVSAPLEVVEVPEQDAVVARIRGPYSQISEAHGMITTFMTENGLADAEADADGLTGKVFNIYLSDPSQTDESELITHVHRPVR